MNSEVEEYSNLQPGGCFISLQMEEDFFQFHLGRIYKIRPTHLFYEAAGLIKVS